MIGGSEKHSFHVIFFVFQAEDGIRDRSPSRGLGDVYKGQNGYSYAAVKCESNTGSEYSVKFLWSPDSVYNLIKLFVKKRLYIR